MEGRRADARCPPCRLLARASRSPGCVCRLQFFFCSAWCACWPCRSAARACHRRRARRTWSRRATVPTRPAVRRHRHPARVGCRLRRTRLVLPDRPKELSADSAADHSPLCRHATRDCWSVVKQFHASGQDEGDHELTLHTLFCSLFSSAMLVFASRISFRRVAMVPQSALVLPCRSSLRPLVRSVGPAW
jgi:hypothetical protein